MGGAGGGAGSFLVAHSSSPWRRSERAEKQEEEVSSRPARLVFQSHVAVALGDADGLKVRSGFLVRGGVLLRREQREEGRRRSRNHHHHHHQTRITSGGGETPPKHRA